MSDMQYLTDLTFASEPLKNIEEKVRDLLLRKERTQATELCATYFEANNYIYSIRDDDTQELWIYFEGIYVPNGKTAIKEFMRKLLRDIYTSQFTNQVIDKIMADVGINKRDFYCYTDFDEYIPVLNGLFNLKTGELEEYDPKKRFFFKFNCEYDENAKCDNIKKFIHDIVSCDNDYNVIQESFGWVFFKKKYQFEKILLFLGNGSNGKSKLCELYKRFFGTAHVANLQPSIIEDPKSFSLHTLFGKIANISPDINTTSLKNTSMLKMLTGNDEVQTSVKFKNDIQFLNTAKFIFGANSLPLVYDTKSGFWRRWILIEFPFDFVEKSVYDSKSKENPLFTKIRDEKIIDKITTPQELSGLFNFAYEGYLRLQKNQSFSYRYSPDEVQSIWIRKSNSFMAFFVDMLDTDYTYSITKKDVRKAYVDYCKNHKIKVMSDKIIARVMQEEGVQDTRLQRENIYDYIWEGIRFKGKFEKIQNMENISEYKPLTIQEELCDLLEKQRENNYNLVVSLIGEAKLSRLLNNGELIQVTRTTIKKGI